jgi:hypothetical protein
MMFPKKCNSLPSSKQGSQYAAVIAQALHESLDKTHRAVKTVMAWTGANQRTVKNWLAGTNGPHGDHLIMLLSNSDAVVDALIGTLSIARRSALMVRLVKLAGSENATDSIASATAANIHQMDFHHSVRHQTAAKFDPDDPDDPDGGPGSHSWHYCKINQRQVWFLQQLQRGREVRAADLERVHAVSKKTAKRDIASLRHFNIIRYVGSPSRGRYMFW